MAISTLPPTPDMRLLTYMSLDLPLGFVTIVKMEQGDSQLLHGDITGKQIHWIRLHCRCSCLEPVFQIKNKYTELQVCKLCACVCIRGGNIYCITQRADMKLEDTLFRVATVHLHTILLRKQGLNSHAAGLCRSCFGYKSIIFKVFRIDITLDNSPLGISNRNFA